MCGRFTLAVPAEQVAAQFQLPATPELAPRYNIAPTQQVAAVRAAEVGRELSMFRWGLVPSWAKDPSVGARMINARAETAAEKPAFRTALRQRRCLIPADGFYEWQAREGGKQPFHIRLADGGLFALAGLYEHWKAPDGAWLSTCTILTTAANALMRPLHDRMPVILAPEHYALWLDPGLRDAGPLQELLAPFPPDRMVATPVSKAVNRATNEGPELLAPAG
ncbi:MAG TPA: SOS response-associated peptidase [Chloroflexaceae bacterium]|nr:SOS response-associated peptidase [Chloroflexaceae bacterium]